MSRLLQVVVSIVVLGLLALAPVSVRGQDDPPVRLRKKPKPPEQGIRSETKKREEKPPQPEIKSKRDPSHEDPEAESLRLQEKLKASLERLSKDFRSVQDRLVKADAGRQTQELQGDIIRGLDELIEHAKQQNAQQQEQQASSSHSRQKQRERLAGENLRQTEASRLSLSAQQRQAGQPRPVAKPETVMQPGEGNKLEELYKDVWGHLPESLRQDMNQYAREQFMPKYGDLLKQYYATIAEKGRRKGE